MSEFLEAVFTIFIILSLISGVYGIGWWINRRWINPPSINWAHYGEPFSHEPIVRGMQKYNLGLITRIELMELIETETDKEIDE